MRLSIATWFYVFTVYFPVINLHPPILFCIKWPGLKSGQTRPKERQHLLITAANPNSIPDPTNSKPVPKLTNPVDPNHNTAD